MCGWSELGPHQWAMYTRLFIYLFTFLRGWGGVMVMVVFVIVVVSLGGGGGVFINISRMNEWMFNDTRAQK